MPQPGQFGNLGRYALHGPGLSQLDFTLHKKFAIDEKRNLEFRGEFYNLFNHANFGLPENDLQSPAFGQILQAAPPRLMQLALKFIF